MYYNTHEGETKVREKERTSLPYLWLSLARTSRLPSHFRLVTKQKSRKSDKWGERERKERKWGRFLGGQDVSDQERDGEQVSQSLWREGMVGGERKREA